MAGFEMAADEAVDIPRVVFDLPTNFVSKFASFMSFHSTLVLVCNEVEVGRAVKSRSGRIEKVVDAWDLKARRATVLETTRLAV